MPIQSSHHHRHPKPLAIIDFFAVFILLPEKVFRFLENLTIFKIFCIDYQNI